MAKRDQAQRLVIKIRPLSANDQLLDDAMAHATAIERLRVGEARKLIRYLNKHVLPKLMEEIIKEAAFVDTGVRQVTRLKRLKEMATSIEQIVRGSMSPLRALIRSDLFKIAKMEKDFQILSLNRAAGFDLRLKGPSTRILRQLVTKQPFQGGTLGQWMSGLNRTVATRARQEIAAGLARGDSIDSIVRNLRRTVPDVARRNLESIVRTGITHVTNQAREETYKENAEVLKGERYTATLDARTTLTCANLDGKIFPVGEGAIPPMHWNCRSTRVPVMKSWDELGIPLKEIPESSRASMDGQVPGDITYEQWLKKQSNKTQNEALGKVRASLFRNGKVGIRDLVNRNFRPINLEQLRKKAGLKVADIRP